MSSSSFVILFCGLCPDDHVPHLDLNGAAVYLQFFIRTYSHFTVAALCKQGFWKWLIISVVLDERKSLHISLLCSGLTGRHLAERDARRRSIRVTALFRILAPSRYFELYQLA